MVVVGVKHRLGDVFTREIFLLSIWQVDIINVEDRELCGSGNVKHGIEGVRFDGEGV